MRPGRKKKRAREKRWEAGREKRGSRTLSIFSIIAIFKIPRGSLCGEESAEFGKLDYVSQSLTDAWARFIQIIDPPTC